MSNEETYREVPRTGFPTRRQEIPGAGFLAPWTDPPPKGWEIPPPGPVRKPPWGRMSAQASLNQSYVPIPVLSWLHPAEVACTGPPAREGFQTTLRKRWRHPWAPEARFLDPCRSSWPPKPQIDPKSNPDRPQMTPTGPLTTSNCSHMSCSHIQSSPIKVSRSNNNFQYNPGTKRPTPPTFTVQIQSLSES